MLDLKKMLDAGVHFGHKTSRWSPKMRPYIWGARSKIHLIDVSKTAILLERAGNFLYDAASKGGRFLFVGTKKAAQDIITTSAKNVNMPYVKHRWIGGTLSNFEQVKKGVTRLLHMDDVIKKSSAVYKKKEISMIQKEVARLEKNVGGIIEFNYPPAALIIVDVKKEHSAVKEASCLGIPVVGLVDTNSDPSDISYIIPANDDSVKSIQFIISYLEDRIQSGLAVHQAAIAQSRAEAAAQRLEAKEQKARVTSQTQEKNTFQQKSAPSQQKTKETVSAEKNKPS